MSHLFRIRHNLAPTYLLPNFRAISTVHSHNTRGSSFNFQLSRELSLSPSSFAFTAIKQWNGLPNNLKDIHEFRVFKRKLKQFLIEQYDWFYTESSRCVFIFLLIMVLLFTVVTFRYLIFWYIYKTLSLITHPYCDPPDCLHGQGDEAGHHVCQGQVKHQEVDIGAPS